MEFLNDIKNVFLPEMIVILFIILNIFFALFWKTKFYKQSKWINIFGIIMAAASLIMVQATPSYYAFKDAIVGNVYTVFFKLLILVVTFFVILISSKVLKLCKTRAFEYFALLLTAVLGALCLISANDFIALFISFETLGISCYLLSAMLKNYKAKEAGLKYLMSGIIASAVLLFGISYLYGCTNVLNLSELNLVINNIEHQGLFTLSVILIISGLTFKIGVAPFANWVPDVYEASSYPVATFLSLVPKIAGFGILSRLLIIFLPIIPVLKYVIVVFALISIIYATYAAIRQENFKRLMGYSSIIHCGLVFLTMNSVNAYNIASIEYYLICYTFMNLAIWSGLQVFYNATGKNNISDYKGIAYTRPFYTTALIISLMALAGLPPTSGFLAKLFIFSALVREEFIFIAFLLIVLILTIIALYFYIKPIKVMFEKTTQPPILENRLVFSKITLYCCTLLTLVLCLFSAPVISICELIAYSLAN